MGGGRHPTPASQQAVDAWVALGGGLGVGIGARLGNVLFWIVEDSNAPEVLSRRWSRAAETVAGVRAKDDRAGLLPEICQKSRYT
jgi:hypothetical protein